MRWLWIVLLMFAGYVNAQQITWQRYFGPTNLGNAGRGIVQLVDSGFVIVAFTTNTAPKGITLIRTDKYGDTLWVKKHDGGQPQKLILTSDSGYAIIAGVFGAGPLLIKTDKNGDTLFTHSYNGNSWGTDVCQTHDGGYVIAIDGYFFKTDSLGNIEWTKTMFYPSAVKQCKNGDIIATGIATGGPDYYGATLVDSAGNIKWERSYGIINDPWNYYAASDVVELPDSNFMVVCDDHIPGGWNLMKINRINGDTMFTKSYFNVNGLNSQSPMVYTSDSNLAIGFGYFLKKIDLSGNEIWNQLLTINAYEIVGCTDGGIAGAGEIYPSPPNSKVAYYKTDSLGDIYNFQGINNLYGNSEAWLYPNPVTTTATLQFKNPQQQNVILTVYDVLGNVVSTQLTMGSNFIINTASLKSGMYFYTLNAGNVLYKGKFVVE